MCEDRHKHYDRETAGRDTARVRGGPSIISPFGALGPGGWFGVAWFCENDHKTWRREAGPFGGSRMCLVTWKGSGTVPSEAAVPHCLFGFAP